MKTNKMISSIFFFEQKLQENEYCGELVNRRCLQSEKKQILQTLAYYYNKLMAGICIILFLSSCNPESQEYIEDPLKPYYNTFLSEAQRLGVQLPDKSVMMYIEDIGSPDGLSLRNKHNCKIRINPRVFDDGLSYSHYAEAIIFHELAHGLLYRDHIPPVDGAVFEASLMTQPSMNFQAWVKGDKRDYYLNELFNIKK